MMDGLYTENAGVIFCHPVGDETIISMIEEGIPCLDIAQQFQGVYKAVDNAKAVLVQDHIEGGLMVIAPCGL